jgi:transposase InsO family protein
MKTHEPLTPREKEHIFEAKLQGATLAELAAELNCSTACVRKWWRRGRDRGRSGLRQRRRGRGPTGPLSRFDPHLARKALALKRKHPRWGAARVLIALATDPRFQGMHLPSRSRLAAFFKLRCPEAVARYHVRAPQPLRPPTVTGVHELWQLDSQEGLALGDGQWATICNVRDPVGAAMIASRAFAVSTAHHWRKLDWTEVRQVLRQAFTEWGTLPDGVQTDNELNVAGAPLSDFPSWLTPWLVGLGVAHRFIRPGHPTDQPQIERTHRSLDNLAVNPQSLRTVKHLQQALDQERQVYNQLFPARASDCAGQPPLQVHPELLRPRRPYPPERELALFDLQRVYAYLATFRFERKVSATGRVSLGRQFYSIRRRNAKRTVQVRCDPQTGEWVFADESGAELERRPLQHLTVETLTGLTPPRLPSVSPIQLTLPSFVA